MTDNVHMQWIWAHFASVQTTLIWVTNFLCIAGLVVSFGYNWHASTTLWVAAFLCKWVECWLLEKTLIEIQESM